MWVSWRCINNYNFFKFQKNLHKIKQNMDPPWGHQGQPPAGHWDHGGAGKLRDQLNVRLQLETLRNHDVKYSLGLAEERSRAEEQSRRVDDYRERCRVAEASLLEQSKELASLKEGQAYLLQQYEQLGGDYHAKVQLLAELEEKCKDAQGMTSTVDAMRGDMKYELSQMEQRLREREAALLSEAETFRIRLRELDELCTSKDTLIQKMEGQVEFARTSLEQAVANNARLEEGLTQTRAELSFERNHTSDLSLEVSRLEAALDKGARMFVEASLQEEGGGGNETNQLRARIERGQADLAICVSERAQLAARVDALEAEKAALAHTMEHTSPPRPRYAEGGYGGGGGGGGGGGSVHTQVRFEQSTPHHVMQQTIERLQAELHAAKQTQPMAGGGVLAGMQVELMRLQQQMQPPSDPQVAVLQGTVERLQAELHQAKSQQTPQSEGMQVLAGMQAELMRLQQQQQQQPQPPSDPQVVMLQGTVERLQAELQAAKMQQNPRQEGVQALAGMQAELMRLQQQQQQSASMFTQNTPQTPPPAIPQRSESPVVEPLALKMQAAIDDLQRLTSPGKGDVQGGRAPETPLMLWEGLLAARRRNVVPSTAAYARSKLHLYLHDKLTMHFSAEGAQEAFAVLAKYKADAFAGRITPGTQSTPPQNVSPDSDLSVVVMSMEEQKIPARKGTFFCFFLNKTTCCQF